MSPPLADRAQILVSFAYTGAVSSFVSTLNKFPSLRSVDAKRWDKVLTAAGIFVAISQLNQEPITKQERSELLDIVTKEALRSDPRAIDALDDCRDFVDSTYDRLSHHPTYAAEHKFLFSDSLGGWIVLNLFDHAPASEEEFRLVRALGAVAVHEFHTWWQV